MNWYREKTWRPISGAAVVGLLVFGLSLQVAPADDSGGLAVQGAASVDRSASSASTPAAMQQREPLSKPLQSDGAERVRASDADIVEAVETRVHFAKIIGSSPVSSAGGAGASRAAGTLGLAEECSCDEDCDENLGDQCNIVQCIVRGICSDDATVVCSSAQAGGSADADCEAADAGTCVPGSFVQRCDVVQLSGWTCESGNGFCIEDRCEDDGLGNEHSVCVPQSSGFSGSDLNPCPSQCVGGAAHGLRCDRSSQCPQGDCLITGGGVCDDATSACYVGSAGTPTGRCCSAEGDCTETDETTCTNGGGTWLRYTDPEQLEGDGNCICPKYGSGVSPNGVDSGSLGPVRPSGLVCEAGSTQQPDPAPIYCEDMDGDGFAPQYCLRRCVGGDNVGALCEVSNPDCATVGACNNGAPNFVVCLVANFGEDCGVCSVSGDNCDPLGFFACPLGEVCEFPGGQSCDATNAGACEDDPCLSNATEGGCEDGFIQIGDDYSLENSSYLRLTQFRFRGGITFQNEDIIFDIWDSTGTILVDTIQVELQVGGIAAPTLNLPLTGIRDWTIEVDCYPTCNANQLEVPQPSPVIIPPNGYVVMRSARTVGTLNGATAFWSQTDAEDDGLNDNTKMWIDGVPVDITTIACATDDECPGTCDGAFCEGTNVLSFELVGVKVPDPIGACCDQGGAACTDTLRWECGQCTPDASPGCSSTLLDCPDGGLTGSVCQFNKWFGPISHIDFEFGGADLTTCGGVDDLEPCSLGGCCQGGLSGFCTVEKETECGNLSGLWLGPATDCDPDCCPKEPTGVDCICETWNCVDDINGSCSDGGAACLVTNNGDDCGRCDVSNDSCSDAIACPGGETCITGGQSCDGIIPGFVCDPANGDDDCDPNMTCTFSCAPDPSHITQLRHPYECHDDFGSPLEPAVACDPANGDADCAFLDPDGTCEQSFTTSVVTSKTDTIDSFYGVPDGDACSLNTNSDRIGWFERFTLVDPTPGDGSDDCFILTVSMCCTDPVLTPIWAFISQYLECPCFEFSDVFGIPPDIDLGNNLLSGFGPASLSHFPCEDENYAGTWTIGPGTYGYQVRAGKLCVGTSPAVSCDTDDDCDGVACILGTADYTLHFTVESCNLGACCISETCIETNRLDCELQDGNFLGDGDQPINTCQAGACSLGSCCVDGTCNDDQFHDTEAECVGFDGQYFGGVGCDASPCPACPFHTVANCQQVQTIFGLVPNMDRNPANGPDEMTAQTLADDVVFGGSVVDTICWNTGFFLIPCCADGCAQNVDDSWEVRIYEADAGCSAIPGAELGRSTLTVLNKIEGTGQGTATWLYSGSLDTPVILPNGGSAGDTYWMEVSGFGEPECAIHATHSRDHGNDHHAIVTWTEEDGEPDPHVYSLNQIGSVDLGLCEDSGLTTPPDVLGACCTCSAGGPGVCAPDFTQKDCVENLRGVWVPCGDCDFPDETCPGIPDNDDCETPYLISNVPTDGSTLDLADQNNICATNDGPGLASGEGGCASSLPGDASLNDDVWYRWDTGPLDCGSLTVDSCGDTDTMDQMISIYLVPDGGGCPLITDDEIGCGDDTCGIGAGPSTVTVGVVPNRSYLIRVGGWNVEVPGGFFGSPRGRFGLHFALELNCEPVSPPVAATEEPHSYRKNRYLSVDPSGALGNNPQSMHIQVTLVSTNVAGLLGGGGTWWATEPVDGAGLSPATCISVVSKIKPDNEPSWAGCLIVHLTGCAIIPTSTYSLRGEAEGSTSSEELLIDTMAIATGKWLGDVVGQFSGPPDNVWAEPNAVVNIDDAVAGIKTFIDPNGVNATHLSITDIHPVLNGEQMTLLVNINDVLLIIAGFQGKTWGEVADPNNGNPPNIPDLTQCP